MSHGDDLSYEVGTDDEPLWQFGAEFIIEILLLQLVGGALLEHVSVSCSRIYGVDVPTFGDKLINPRL